ncbi:MAG: helix-turn-helix domain-containing protein, partial [Clostridium sp.]
VFMLNNKVKSLAFKSVREKVINFILELQKSQQNDLVKLKSSKEDIASYLGIPRPSLSRELIKLREDKLIEFDRSSINILNLEALEEELFK